MAAGCGETDDSPKSGDTAPRIVHFSASPQTPKFVLTATGSDGDVATAELEVPSVPPPAIDTFGAMPGRVGRGEEVHLSWTRTDASRVELEIGGQPVDAELEVDGTHAVALDADATIVLKAFNAAGAVEERTVTVTIGPRTPS